MNICTYIHLRTHQLSALVERIELIAKRMSRTRYMRAYAEIQLMGGWDINATMQQKTRRNKFLFFHIIGLDKK